MRIEHTSERHAALSMVANGHVERLRMGGEWEWHTPSDRRTKGLGEALTELLDARLIRLEGRTTVTPGRMILPDLFRAVVTEETGEDTLNAWSASHPVDAPS